jgi:hypothetical protein
MRSDPRPPLVVIRSFLDDNISATSGLVGVLGSTRLEEWLSLELTRYGPVIAIGSGKETTTTGGASRDYFTVSEWKGAIQDWINRASVIIALVGETPGFEWELREAIRARGPDVLLLVFPPRPPKERKHLVENVRALFQETVAIGLPSFDASHVIGLLMRADDNGLAIISRSATGLEYRLAIQALMGNIGDRGGRPTL